MNKIGILNRVLLKEQLEALLNKKIQFTDFKEWIFEIIASDLWEIDSEDKDLLSEIIFTFDDDTIKWTEDVWKKVATIAIECMNYNSSEKARTVFIEKVSEILHKKLG